LLKGLIFDFDGTLYGDWRLWVSLIQETLQEFNLNITGYDALEKAREQIANGTFVNISGVAIALARDNGLDVDKEGPWGHGQIRTRFLNKMDEHMDKTGLDPRILTMLKKYHREGMSLGIVTFMRAPRLYHRLETWHLKPYFQSLVTPEMIQSFKPAPEPFIKAMNDMNVSSKDCIVIGDEPADMTGGKKAGAGTVGIPCGFFSEIELKQAGADHVLESLLYLPRITG
jgi:HAD superfamily hydrolase (TIGR01509 family)